MENTTNEEWVKIFYKKIKEYTHSCFYEINHSIADKNSVYKHFYTQEEICVIVVLNKAFFQNLIGFFKLNELKLAFPAFNSLRAAIEALRLFRAFFTDSDFRCQYIKNKNTNFRNTPDYDFMQKKVNNILEKQEKELRSKDSIPFSILLSNHNLTKGSAMSEMHSELSKWSHLLNVNLLIQTHLNDSKIYLGFETEDNDIMKRYINKYIEVVYHLVITHSSVFVNVEFSSKFYDMEDEMVNLYVEYINRFY